MKIKKILIFLFSLVVVSYFGYQVYVFLTATYKMEIVNEHVLYDTIKTSGITIRNEKELVSDVQGAYYYVYENATKVADNSVVIDVYPSEQDILHTIEYDAIMQQIKNLQLAHSSGEIGNDAEILSKQLHQQLGNLIDQTTQGSVKKIEEIKYKISLILNRKDILSGKKVDFSDKIAQLEQNSQEIKSKISTKLATITAKQGGYFSSDSDGLESVLTIDSMDTMTALDFIEYIDNPKPTQTTSIGKIVDGFYWYIATKVPASKTSAFKVGKKYKVDFPQIDLNDIPVVVEKIVSDPQTNDLIVIFKANYINDQILGMRNADIDIKLIAYSGLKVSRSAIRYNEQNEPGVFVKKGQQVWFKKIDIIYEEAGFILSKPNYKENYLAIYDEIVIEGKDLYEGKPVK